jgi:hypothetical protein
MVQEYVSGPAGWDAPGGGRPAPRSACRSNRRPRPASPPPSARTKAAGPVHGPSTGADPLRAHAGVAPAPQRTPAGASSAPPRCRAVRPHGREQDLKGARQGDDPHWRRRAPLQCVGLRGGNAGPGAGGSTAGRGGHARARLLTSALRARAWSSAALCPLPSLPTPRAPNAEDIHYHAVSNGAAAPAGPRVQLPCMPARPLPSPHPAPRQLTPPPIPCLPSPHKAVPGWGERPGGGRACVRAGADDPVRRIRIRVGAAEVGLHAVAAVCPPRRETSASVLPFQSVPPKTPRSCTAMRRPTSPTRSRTQTTSATRSRRWAGAVGRSGGRGSHDRVTGCGPARAARLRGGVPPGAALTAPLSRWNVIGAGLPHRPGPGERWAAIPEFYSWAQACPRPQVLLPCTRRAPVSGAAAVVAASTAPHRSLFFAVYKVQPRTERPRYPGHVHKPGGCWPMGVVGVPPNGRGGRGLWHALASRQHR